MLRELLFDLAARALRRLQRHLGLSSNGQAVRPTPPTAAPPPSASPTPDPAPAAHYEVASFVVVAEPNLVAEPSLVAEPIAAPPPPEPVVDNLAVDVVESAKNHEVSGDSAIEVQIVEPPPELEPEPSPVELAASDPSSTESSAVHATAVAPSPVETTEVGPSAVEAGAVESGAAAPSPAAPEPKRSARPPKTAKRATPLEESTPAKPEELPVESLALVAVVPVALAQPASVKKSASAKGASSPKVAPSAKVASSAKKVSPAKAASESGKTLKKKGNSVAPAPSPTDAEARAYVLSILRAYPDSECTAEDLVEFQEAGSQIGTQRLEKAAESLAHEGLLVKTTEGAQAYFAWAHA